MVFRNQWAIATMRLLLDCLHASGDLEVQLAGQEPRHSASSKVALELSDSAAVWQLLLNPELALGELFTDGRLTVKKGDLIQLIELVAPRLSSLSASLPGKIWTSARRARTVLTGPNTKQRARRYIAHHYDLDARLYPLFLDADRQYSCAYFDRADSTLDEAQLAKKRHLAAKLLIRPSHRICDIGCGWGGLALYLAEMCDAKVSGVTLSKEQLTIARKRAKRRGLDKLVEFRLQDYRGVGDVFDRIVSVGMFEHVGPRRYPTFFRAVSAMLAEDGLMVLHSIGRSDGPSPTNPWIAKHIFPGGYIPALSEVVPLIERAGLVITDVEILRGHYARTLNAWRQNFLSRRDEAESLFGYRFCRLWEFYLAVAEAAFRYFGLVVFQIQIAKKHTQVPLTRDYIGECERALRIRELSSHSTPHVAASAFARCASLSNLGAQDSCGTVEVL